MKSTAQVGMFSVISNPISRPDPVKLKWYMEIVTWAETASTSTEPKTMAAGLDASAIRKAGGAGGAGTAPTSSGGRGSRSCAGPRAGRPRRRDSRAEASLARIGKVAIAASVTARLCRRLRR
jgi:hypothetical protein